MRNETIFRVVVLATAAVCFGFGFAPRAAGQQAANPAGATTSGDAVADAARKAREEQKATPKPKKVYTNDDMPTNPADTTTAAVKGDPSLQRGPENPSDADADTKGETFWRKKFKKAHEKLAQAEQELSVLQRELDKNQVQYYNDPQKALMQQYNRSDIGEKTAKVDAKKNEIEALKQQLSDMEDDLRKAGGDPGWAR
jgi:hypothetical protein